MPWAIPLIAVSLTYIFGRLQSHASHKKQQCQLRYDSFYVPFVSRLYAGYMWERPFSSNDVQARSVFFDLIVKNVQFLGHRSQALLPEVYKSFLDMLEYDEGNPGYLGAPEIYDSTMNRFTKAMLEEGSLMSRKLRLPNLCKPFEVLGYLSQEQHKT